MNTRNLPYLLQALMTPLFILTLQVGCNDQTKDIAIVSRSLKMERSTNTGVPDEFSSYAPAAAGYTVWVEGKVKNSGAADANNLILSFKCVEGANTRILTAELKQLPAGKTVDFKTRLFQSKLSMTLGPEEPEISLSK